MNVSKTLTESITKIIQELKNKKNDCFNSFKSKQKGSLQNLNTYNDLSKIKSLAILLIDKNANKFGNKTNNNVTKNYIYSKINNKNKIN